MDFNHFLRERRPRWQRLSALLDRIWPEGYVDEANLAQNVYVLRKVLRGRWDVEAIETIPRRGYRFVTIPELLRADAGAATRTRVREGE